MSRVFTRPPPQGRSRVLCGPSFMPSAKRLERWIQPFLEETLKAGHENPCDEGRDAKAEQQCANDRIEAAKVGERDQIEKEHRWENRAHIHEPQLPFRRRGRRLRCGGLGV